MRLYSDIKKTLSCILTVAVELSHTLSDVADVPDNKCILMQNFLSRVTVKSDSSEVGLNNFFSEYFFQEKMLTTLL